MTRRLIALALSIAATGCYSSHVRLGDAGSPDAPADAPLETFVGCDDPRIWEAAALETGPSVEIGGEACSPAQYPAHIVGLGARSTYALLGEEAGRIVRSCWRVVAAHPESGWDIGRVLESASPWIHVHAIGHERPVTFEGRLIRDDGAVRVAVRDAVVVLDPPRVLDEDLRELVAIGRTAEGPATTAVSLARAGSISIRRVERATEGEVIAATARGAPPCSGSSASARSSSRASTSLARRRRSAQSRSAHPPRRSSRRAAPWSSSIDASSSSSTRAR